MHACAIMPRQKIRTRHVYRRTLDDHAKAFVQHARHKQAYHQHGRNHGFRMGNTTLGGITALLKRELWPTFDPASVPVERDVHDKLPYAMARARGIGVERALVDIVMAKSNKDERAILQGIARDNDNGTLDASSYRSIAAAAFQVLSQTLAIDVLFAQLPIVDETYMRCATAVDFVGVHRESGDVVFIELKTTGGLISVGAKFMQPPLEAFVDCPQTHFMAQLAWPMAVACDLYGVDSKRLRGLLVRATNKRVTYADMDSAFFSAFRDKVMPELRDRASRRHSMRPARPRRRHSRQRRRVGSGAGAGAGAGARRRRRSRDTKRKAPSTTTRLGKKPKTR